MVGVGMWGASVRCAVFAAFVAASFLMSAGAQAGIIVGNG
jgi:hypothetical protein